MASDKQFPVDIRIGQRQRLCCRQGSSKQRVETAQKAAGRVDAHSPLDRYLSFTETSLPEPERRPVGQTIAASAQNFLDLGAQLDGKGSGAGRNSLGCHAAVANRWFSGRRSDGVFPLHPVPSGRWTSTRFLNRVIGETQTTNDAGVVAKTAEMVRGRPVAYRFKGEPSIGSDVVDVRPVR